ncbi:response regulator transcription factor [Nitratidesulfovibrio termitidis]|uniref:response regulator transcription factor n=1 Tax=Nitratidesulfovibrio termitidis TaxID=42252 RepID=UPI00054DB211|nr:response regulator transcription factor [Nitratidesulfovibrio termitidis]
MDRVLLIDDDKELCALLTEYLAPEGLAVEPCHTGGQGLARALSGDYDAALLDVALPDASGFDVLGTIRSRSALPVLMLTGRGDDVDRIVGLEMGADDYVPKPFVPRELLARLRAVLRRTRLHGMGGVAGSASTGGSGGVGGPGYVGGVGPYRKRNLSFGGITVDRSARTALREGAPLPLTPVEYAILVLLLEAEGATVTREDISRGVLGREILPFDRSIDVHVSNLRKKLGPCDDGQPRVGTVRGTGYYFRVSPTESTFGGQDAAEPRLGTGHENVAG